MKVNVVSSMYYKTSLGRISRKVLARSQAQMWDFCLKLLEYFTWAHGLSLNGFHKRSQSQLWLSHWLKCWDWLKVGLSFVNKGSNMAAIILSSLQNLKWLKIGYKYIKQPPEVVFGCLHVYNVSHCKMAFDQRYYVSNKEHICHQ